jgi:hypothetical protein
MIDRRSIEFRCGGSTSKAVVGMPIIHAVGARKKRKYAHAQGAARLWILFSDCFPLLRRRRVRNRSKSAR